jgi:hypothetical protein
VVPAEAALALRLLLGLGAPLVEDAPDLLGTPTAGMCTRSEAFRGRNPNPVELVAMLPTPKTRNNENRQSLGYGPNLGEALAMLPTPVVNDMGDGKTPPQWDEWTSDMKTRHGNGNGHGRSLAIEAQRITDV